MIFLLTNHQSALFSTSWLNRRVTIEAPFGTIVTNNDAPLCVGTEITIDTTQLPRKAFTFDYKGYITGLDHCFFPENKESSDDNQGFHLVATAKKPVSWLNPHVHTTTMEDWTWRNLKLRHEIPSNFLPIQATDQELQDILGNDNAINCLHKSGFDFVARVDKVNGTSCYIINQDGKVMIYTTSAFCEPVADNQKKQ